MNIKPITNKFKRLLTISLSLAIILTFLPTNTVEVHAEAQYISFQMSSLRKSGSWWLTQDIQQPYYENSGDKTLRINFEPDNSSYCTVENGIFKPKNTSVKLNLYTPTSGRKFYQICKMVLVGENGETTTVYRNKFSIGYNQVNFVKLNGDSKGRVNVQNENSGGSFFYLKEVRIYYHDLEAKSSAATCTTAGYKTYYKCKDSGCNRICTENNVFKPYIVTQDTYGINGFGTEDQWKSANPIAALGHSLGYVATKNPTCTEDGYNQYYRCGICGKVYTNSSGTGPEYANESTWKTGAGKKPKLGHNFQYSVQGNMIYATCTRDPLHKAKIELSASDETYTGSAIKNATVTPWSPNTFNASLVTAPNNSSIFYEAAGDSSLTDGNPVNAGNYVAKVSITKDSNAYTAQKAFRIKPKDIAETIITPTYNNTNSPEWNNNSPYTQSITIKDTIGGAEKTLVVGTDYELSGDNLTQTAPGIYTVTITGKGNYQGTTTVEWEIIPKQFTLDVGADEIDTVTVTPYSGIYDGVERSINVEAPEGTTVTYSTSENGTYTETNPTFKDAGDHTVYFKVDKEGYATLSDHSEVLIAHRVVKVEWSAAADNIFTYDGQPKAPTATITNIVGNDDVSVVLGGKETNARPSLPYTAIAKDLTGADAKNYKLPVVEPSCHFTINKAKVDIPQPLQTTYTYNRQEQYLLSESDLYTITGNARTDAGSQETNVTLKDIDNYEWNTDEESQKIADQLYTFEIERRDISNEARVVMPTTHFFLEYDDETPGFTVTLDVYDKIGNDDRQLVMGPDKEYSIAGQTQETPGIYDLYITFNGNYTGSIVKHWSIHKDTRHEKPVTLPETEGVTYDGKVTVVGAGDDEVPDFDLNNPLALLTPEEMELLKDTDHDPNTRTEIEIILSLNTLEMEELDEDSLSAIEEILKSPTGVHYYDITIRKVIKKYNGTTLLHTDTHYVTETDEHIELTIHIPEEILPVKGGYSRKFSVIRSHKNTDGTYTATALDTEYLKSNEEYPNGAITFTSDKFSDYVLAYKDTRIPYKAPDTSVR